MMVCEKCVIAGRVQGVWYRGSTQQKAEGLGLVGYAKNLRDGTVEVLACGEPDAIAKLKQWLWQGPQHAEVEQVRCESHQPDSMPVNFSTG